MTAMTVQQDTPRITADEFLSGVPGDPYPIGSEPVDCVVYESDPDFRHQEICARVLDALAAWTDGRQVGWGGNWVLSARNVYKPDVWFKQVPPTGARNDGPPDLAVELRSPGRWHLDIGRARGTSISAE